MSKFKKIFAVSLITTLLFSTIVFADAYRPPVINGAMAIVDCDTDE